mgnify:CR=1 FL=1
MLELYQVIKMKKLLNEKEISPSCSYCEFGKCSPDGETVLCKKKGIVEKDFSCRKFSYDVLKRQPRRPLPLQKYNKEDFSL